jgi:hypothetical protein
LTFSKKYGIINIENKGVDIPMAEVKMIRTTHDKLTEELIPIEDGSYIVVLDTKELYLDKGENRKRLSFARSTSYDMIEDYAFSAGTAYSKG